MSEAPAIALVVAAARNGVIGHAGKLPWRLPSDLKLFRRLTLGKPVIMGRKTYEAIGKPLDRRDNIVVTGNRDFVAAGVIVCHGIDDALARAEDLARKRGAAEIAVIGGGELYRAVLPRADRIYLTRVDATPSGDTVFAPLDPGIWIEASREPLPRDSRDEHAAELIVLERRR